VVTRINGDAYADVILARPADGAIELTYFAGAADGVLRTNGSHPSRMGGDFASVDLD
jgi:hypothetical protein